jgi:hypothetical protein
MKASVIAAGMALVISAPAFGGDYCVDTPAPQLSPDQLAYCRLTRAQRWGIGSAGTVKFNRAAAEERAATPHNDAGAIPLCAPPHRMTRDGCQ